MGEAEARLGRVIACHGNIISSDDQVRALRVIDGVQEGVGVQVTELLQQFEAEIAADDGGVCQRYSALFADPLEAPADDKTDAFGHVELADLKVRPPAPLRVKQPPLLGQVLEDFFHKEGVTFGLAVDRLDERRRWWLACERAQHGLNAGLRERLESDAVSKPLPDQ